MEKRSSLHIERIETRGENKVFTVEVPSDAREIVGVIVTTKLTGNPIAVNRHYFGNAVPGVLDNAFIQSLFNEQMESTVKVFDVNVGIGEKLFYARPVRIDGFPSFEIDNVSAGFGNPTTVSVVDSETGYTEEYYIFQSNDSAIGQVKLYVY